MSPEVTSSPCASHSLLTAQDVPRDERVAAIHSSAEVFPPRTEHVYKYLQVFSACCVSFAHGANDVANSVGPFAGIWWVPPQAAAHTLMPDF
jgi:phosphate/sulfate permease